MIGVYFSGTGNTRYCLEKFLSEYQGEEKSFSIEDPNVIKIKILHLRIQYILVICPR